MAQLVPCKSCKTTVSKSATTCPNCGQKHPGLSAKENFMATVFFLIVAVVLFKACTSDNSDRDVGTQLSQAQPYQVLSIDDVSFAGRKRVQVNITAPQAATKEQLSQTAIKAAIDEQERRSAQVIYIFLGDDMEQINNGEAFAIARYAPDGGGNSGDQGWKWQVEAAESTEVDPDRFILRQPLNVGER